MKDEKVIKHHILDQVKLFNALKKGTKSRLLQCATDNCN